MRGEYDKIINNRFKSMGFFVVAIACILFWRMYDIEIKKHDQYLAMAEGQQRFDKTEMAARGKILVHDSFVDDKEYYPLAFDVKRFAVWAVPRQIGDKKSTANELSALLSMASDDIFSKIDNQKMYIPPLKRGLTLDEAIRVEDKKIGGIIIMPEYSRYYPEGSLAGQVLGFVNNEGDGKYGFEGHYNNELKGKNGNVVGEKDTIGRMINLLQQNDPKDGMSYVLTIDRSVQYFVEKKLSEAITEYKADAGTVIIMDVQTGGIVAMANLPTYDPNNYKEQAAIDQSLFMNQAISYTYEPGSILKPLIMSAAIDQGLITPETTETFDWHVFVGNDEIKTAERKAFGLETMTEVLQNSDNVAMVWIANKLGNSNQYKYLQAFNMLDKTGIDLDGEVPGYTTSLKQWRDITRATVSFGQGIAVTPIEMVAAYAAIANDGMYIEPHVVDKIVDSYGTEKKVEKVEGQRVISEDTSAKMREMLYQVVEKGHSWRAKVPGFKIGAKTGTAQIAKPEGGYEESEDGLGVFVHSLAGFAPTDSPRFAMIVKLDRPRSARYAESTAAPLFGEISSFLLNYHYRETPTEPLAAPHAP